MRRLEELFLFLRTEQEVAAFLTLLLSRRERDWMRRRWRSVQASLSGATQRKISKEIRISLTTAGRGARSAEKHSQLINRLLDRMNEEQNLRDGSAGVI
jgi:uncharacterized protein YerC